MKTDTSILLDTMYSSYSASGYDRWKDEIVGMITRYQAEMKGLNRCRIVDHMHLAEEVSMTVYEDGTKVYVNYSNDVFKFGSVRIPARDYVVERGSAQ